MTWIVRTNMNFGWGEPDLRLGFKDFDGSYSVVQPFTFKTYRVGDYIDAVTIPAGTSKYNPNDFLQACVDHAADIGIFPTTKAAPTKEIEALRYHLEDMRKLVFK